MNSKKRILIFSDFDSIRNILVKGLSNKGYQVIETKTYEEANAQLNGTSFGLIITDNDVKAQSGKRFIDTTRKITSYLYTPIMLMHSAKKEQLSEEYASYNIACYMNKPFDMQKFYSIVERIV